MYVCACVTGVVSHSQTAILTNPCLLKRQSRWNTNYFVPVSKRKAGPIITNTNEVYPLMELQYGRHLAFRMTWLCLTFLMMQFSNCNLSVHTYEHKGTVSCDMSKWKGYRKNRHGQVNTYYCVCKVNCRRTFVHLHACTTCTCIHVC